MRDADDNERLIFDDVQVVAERSRLLLCQIRDRTVWLHPTQMLAGSDVHGRGDRGRLVLAKWLADDLDLI